MAVIGVTIADNTIATRVVAAIAGNAGYQPLIGVPPVANPQNRQDFVAEFLKRWMKDQVRVWEANQAVDIARKTAADKVAAEVIIP